MRWPHNFFSVYKQKIRLHGIFNIVDILVVTICVCLLSICCLEFDIVAFVFVLTSYYLCFTYLKKKSAKIHFIARLHVSNQNKHKAYIVLEYIS